MAFTDLIPWRRSSSPSEMSPMFSLQRDINRMFEDFFRNGGTKLRMFQQEGYSFFPDLDIEESEKHIDLTVEVPGMSEKDIRLNLSEDGEMLTIEGEKRMESEKKTEDMYCSERRFGRFRRVVALPGRVDPNKVEATCKNGVLKIHMNRLPESEQKAKQIPIKSA